MEVDNDDDDDDDIGDIDDSCARDPQFPLSERQLRPSIPAASWVVANEERSFPHAWSASHKASSAVLWEAAVPPSPDDDPPAAIDGAPATALVRSSTVRPKTADTEAAPACSTTEECATALRSSLTKGSTTHARSKAAALPLALFLCLVPFPPLPEPTSSPVELPFSSPPPPPPPLLPSVVTMDRE